PENMPFTQDGVTPDALINPHCLSRMTVGHVREMMAGSIAAKSGVMQDGTPMSSDHHERAQRIEDDLTSVAGFPPGGETVMYDGRTGLPLRRRVFMHLCFYEKLRHMVMDKLHARSRGPNDSLVRQPEGGRAKDGGLRFGEMERDCCLAHGAASILRERLFQVSDFFQTSVCTTCGEIGTHKQTARGRLVCHVCHRADTLQTLELPYAAKLLTQELRSMGVNVRYFPQGGE
ncbi:MAG: DNA-directed RNA polymerase subunit B, partial [bacterium]|nr:DNA-directed RNA polymerase subunit B [bacterium]